MPKPDFIGGDGVKVLKNPLPFRLDKQDVTCLQAGNSYVVLNPFIGNLRERVSEHLTVTVIGNQSNQPTLPEKRNVPLTAPILTRDADFTIGDVLYSTRCSLRYNTCMTESLPVAEALKANIVEFRDFTVFGSLAGALLGLLVCLNYRHSRGVERQLRRAIKQDRLRVVYQPVVDLATRQIIGAEALARWTDEDGLAVGPDVFVKIAEERGFVTEITRLVVRHVLREFAKTFHANPDFRVNINITVADLSDPAFPPMLERELQRAHVSPHNIGLEITESSSAREQSLIEAIILLRRRGHRIYIDDFGTGYSSLSYLHDLSIDAIKIDKAFTHAIGTEAVTVGILPQILSMAASLNLQVVAEGIETEQQGAFFSANDYPVLAQGWLYGHPFPAQEFLRILVEDQKKASVFAHQ
jgi:sensor c-di-GMP phosphodiesterase-like protein